MPSQDPASGRQSNQPRPRERLWSDDCPGGATLGPIGKPVVRSGVARQRYRSKPKVCAVCPQAAQCLSEGVARREIERSEHAEAIERHREQMDGEDARGKMRERAALCEHHFGTLYDRPAAANPLLSGETFLRAFAARVSGGAAFRGCWC